MDKGFVGFVCGVGEYVVGVFGDIKGKKMKRVMEVGYEGVLV